MQRGAAQAGKKGAAQAGKKGAKRAAKKGAGKVLQKGGNVINKATRKVLGLSREQAKNAIEALKKDLRLPPNFHGNIMSNGDLVHPETKEILGNLFHYLH